MTLKTGADFDGADYQSERDKARLTGQIYDVYSLMRDGEWRSLSEIAKITGHPESSISAQLRNLRKADFGNHVIDRVHIKDGLYRYRLDVNAKGNSKPVSKEKRSKEQIDSAFQIAQTLFDMMVLRQDGAIIRLTPLDTAIIENLAIKAGLEK